MIGMAGLGAGGGDADPTAGPLTAALRPLPFAPMRLKAKGT